MNAHNFNKALSDIDARYLDEALEELDRSEDADSPRRQKTAGRGRMRIFILAAAVLLTAAALIGIPSFALAQKEYSEALAFFRAQALSEKGLSRTEIRMVYKDIEGKTFLLDQTREVILRSIDPGTISGEQIDLEHLTPEQLRNFWSYIGNRYLWQGKNEPAWAFENDYEAYSCRISRRENGREVFSVEVPDLYAFGLSRVSGGAVVYGIHGKGSRAHVAMISDDGTLLWNDLRERYEMRFEFYRGAFEREDGSIVFIGYGRRISVKERKNTLCFAVYEKSGEERTFVETPLSGTSPSMTSVLPLNNGYLASLRRSPARGKDAFVLINGDGSVSELDFYKIGKNNCLIEDVASIGGISFVSVTTVPKSYVSSGAVDLSDALDVCLSELRANGVEPDSSAYASEALARAFSEHIGAMLLIWDAEKGEAREFYKLDGAIAGKIEEQEGRFVWTVSRPTGIVLEPGYEEPRGTALVQNIIFDNNGAFESVDEPGDYQPIDWS